MFKFLTENIENFKEKIANTTSALVNSVVESVSGKSEFSEFLLDEIEDTLISADLGVNLTSEIVDKLRNQTRIKPDQIKDYLKKEFKNILHTAGKTNLKYENNKINIYFITGVNGAGKTTLIGKLAYKFKNEGKKVLVVAADTFRAAAEEQLDIWSKRAGADIVRRDKADSASVVYEGIQKAKSEKYDVILIDTAGRLQNKFNLMEELAKIKSVINKNAPDSLMESILVIDANTGQNGIEQARMFTTKADITAVALTKLDGSAKGAIILSIAKEFGLPIKLVGIGEKMEDLKPFNPDEFLDALFS